MRFCRRQWTFCLVETGSPSSRHPKIIGARALAYKGTRETCFDDHGFSGFRRKSTTPDHTTPAYSGIRRQTSLFKCNSENSQGHISETTRWIFILKRWKFRYMSQQEEEPSRYTRTLVVKPALCQMYDQQVSRVPLYASAPRAYDGPVYARVDAARWSRDCTKI